MNKLNKTQGVATNSMFVFGHQHWIGYFPSGMIGLRAAAGAQYPGSIILTTMMAGFSTTVAILSAGFYLDCPCLSATRGSLRSAGSGDQEILAFGYEGLKRSW